MERRTIFVVGILFFTLIISGISIYLYYQQQKARQSTFSFFQDQPAKSGFAGRLASPPTLIDIKGSAIINGIDLLVLTKTQVKNGVKKMVPSLSLPLPLQPSPHYQKS